jgi:hypothetical protein
MQLVGTIYDMSKLPRWLFLGIVTVLVFIIATKTTIGTFYGDFWEHAAAVGILTQDPATNEHPIFKLTARHAFLSPYAVLVACASSIFNESSINTLAFFGLVNFFLFILGLHFYAASLGVKTTFSASIYSLLSIIFLWGHNASLMFCLTHQLFH